MHTRHWSIIALGVLGACFMFASGYVTPEQSNQAHAVQTQVMTVIGSAVALLGGQDVIKGWIVDLRKNPKAGVEEILQTLFTKLGSAPPLPSTTQNSTQSVTGGK